MDIAIYNLDHDIQCLLLKASSFPDGITEAHHTLHDRDHAMYGTT